MHQWLCFIQWVSNDLSSMTFFMELMMHFQLMIIFLQSYITYIYIYKHKYIYDNFVQTYYSYKNDVACTLYINCLSFLYICITLSRHDFHFPLPMYYYNNNCDQILFGQPTRGIRPVCVQTSQTIIYWLINKRCETFMHNWM